jgi:hypothetical protein
MKTGFVAACFAAAVAVSTGTASAALLTYTETADVSGSLDGVPFTDNVLTLKAVGDTSSVSGGPSFFLLDVPLTFTLSGGGSGTFTDDETAVIANQAATLAGSVTSRRMNLFSALRAPSSPPMTCARSSGP